MHISEAIRQWLWFYEEYGPFLCTLTDIWQDKRSRTLLWTFKIKQFRFKPPMLKSNEFVYTSSGLLLQSPKSSKLKSELV